MVDVVDHVYDIMDVFQGLYRFCKPTTQVILTTINPWWDPILMFMEKIGAKMPEGPHNFVEKGNLTRILELMNFSVSYSGYMLLFPKKVPVLSEVKISPVSNLKSHAKDTLPTYIFEVHKNQSSSK